MKAYSFNRETKEYQGEVSCQPNPVDGGFLIPGHATNIKPEQPKEGNVMVFKDGGWVEVIDSRGQYYDKKTKEEILVIGYNVDLSNLTKEVPKDHDHTWNEELGRWEGHIEYLKLFEVEDSYGHPAFKEGLSQEKNYILQRSMAYPLVHEQLDMLYWDKINKTNNWVESITKIKEKYPKPENENEKV